MYKNMYISLQMSMEYQSYAPWFEKVAQTHFDKPIFKLLPIEFDLMCNLPHFYHFVYM